MLSTLLCALSLAIPTLTAPPRTQHSKRLAENKPWHLSDIVLGPSSFSFQFSDENTGLELQTTCSRTITGSNTSIIDPETYYPCSNQTVSYRLGDGVIDVERGYIDLAVGEYPYDFVTAFGHATLNFTDNNSTGFGTVAGVDVFVTEEIA
ncbi:hypothetical protein BDV97DRAFT_50861 [Delphinella strobiligena]|nr:hypothetical protein BDV97DRAFT_50861 [Delphinella strobiligena]